MAQFDLKMLRDVADEGIARHGLRGYARKLGLDVSTMRSLRDGRDMQISKLSQIIEAMDMTLALEPRSLRGAGRASKQPAQPEMARIPFHPLARPHPDADAPIALDKRWIGGNGWATADLCCVIAPDAASVMPAGTLCLVDCGQTWPGAHAIWACIDDGALMLRYMGRPEPGMLLLAGLQPGDAPRIVTGPALDLITPLGRVVWAGSRIAIPTGIP
jgi:hypothetical protein